VKVVAITGKKACCIVERPDPQIADDYVKVRIRSIPMCTEYKAYAKGTTGDALGHEAAGDVIEVAQPGTVSVGDRVVVMPQMPCGKCWLCLKGEYIHCQAIQDFRRICNTATGEGTYSEYCIRKDWQLIPIPKGMSYDHASMACCGLGPTLGAMQNMVVTAYDTIVITGMGPVGLGGVINGTSRGAQVIAVEPHEYRRQLAKELGAVLVIDPASQDAVEEILNFTNGEGADKSIDCSGSRQGQRLLIDATRLKGQLAFVGESGDLTIGVSNDLIRKGLILRGSWHYNLADTPLIMTIIAEQKTQIDKLITHRFPMDRVQEAWELQLTGESGKVILTPDHNV
jgi:L-iditol 2-dehydrogenase